MKAFHIFKSRVVHFVLVLVLMLAVFNMNPASTVHAAQSGDYTYSISDGQATIEWYQGWDSTVNIPATLGGYPVTKIGNYAFEFGSFTKVSIPDSVVSIGEGAFFACENLTGVSLGSGLLSIGEGAFYGCSFTKVTIPNNVISIGESAFASCNSLTGVSLGSGVTSIGYQSFTSDNLAAFTVNANNRAFASQDGVLFNKDKTQLIQYPAGKTGASYTIPAGVATIGECAFCGCSRLTGVNIPDSVTAIGEYSFWGCAKLTGVSIGSGVTSIDENAFVYCDLLSALTVSADNAVYASQSGVVFNKAKTQLILYPAGRSNASYTVPGGVTAIGNFAFYGCGKLTSATMPDSVTDIGEGAFGDCIKLESVNLGNGLTRIGGSAFMYCLSLTGVAIPDSVTSIGDFAFAECYKLAQADIGTGVTDIGEYAFAYCESLTAIVVPDSVTGLGESAFEECVKLASAEIGDGVIRIEQFAFAGCSGLSGVSLGSGITEIGDFAFIYCQSLSGITILENVTGIGSMAFYGCESLSASYFMGNAPKASLDTFAKCGPYFTSYYLSGKTGFTNPWKGHPTAVFDPGASYTVAFSLGGASGTPPDAQTVYDGVKAQKPKNPARNGYTFSGWYADAACAGAAWDFSDPVTADTTLYAKWTPLPPTTPSSAKAASASHDSLKLTWGASSFASGYEIYRTSSGGTIYSKIATVTGTRTYTVSGLTCGTAYYYKVRAYRDTGTSKKYSGYSSVMSAEPVPQAPGSVKTALAPNISVNVSWGAVSGATKYEVWRATSKTGAYTLLTTTASTGYTNTGCMPGKTYYYKVRAYKTAGSVKVYGGYSPAVSRTMKLATPVSAAISETYNSVRVEWNAQPAASGYEVWRATSAGGTYAKIYTGASGSCIRHTDTGLTTNKTYYYKVRAYQKVGQDKAYGNFSPVVSAKPVPSAPADISVVRLSPTSVKVDWDPVAGTTKYEVRRSATKAGTFVPVGETAVSVYYNTGLPADEKYYYKVRAYRLVGTTKVYGLCSAVACP